MGEIRLTRERRSRRAGNVLNTPPMSSRCLRGFTPRKAAKSEDTGGSEAMWCATPCGTPCRAKPRVSVLGRLLASPVIMSEKKTPTESAMPEFWNVARMPEAAPR